MTGTHSNVRAVLVAGVVLTSVAAGALGTTAPVHASDEANSITVVSTEPVDGSGTLTVRADLSPGADEARFKVLDAAGNSSRSVIIEDGGPLDEANGTDDVIVADLDLGDMYDSPPASGEALVAVDEGGDAFSFDYQTYDTKRQFVLDADAPHVRVIGDSSSTSQDTVRTTNERQIKLAYTITDQPQKIASGSLEIVSPGGEVVRTFADLQAGEGRAVQFTVPKYWDAGEYDIRVNATDEVGHTTSGTFQDGLIIEPTDVSVSSQNVRVMEDQPVRGTQSVTLKIGTAYPGADAAIKIRDAAGTVSERVVVTDGGPADQATTEGVIVTDVDLDAVYDEKPASGDALVGVDHDADPFSFAYQTYDVKRQLAIDAEAPTVNVTGSSTTTAEPMTATPGEQVQILYTIHDDPQKIDAATMRITGPDGTPMTTIDGLEAGDDRKVQFEIPSDWAAGNYTIEVTATDEVGHTTTDTFEDGLVVTST